MRKAYFIMVIIFTVVNLNVFVYAVHGTCIEDCKQQCDASISEKYRSGEGYVKSIKDSTSYLKQKNDEKVMCKRKCEEKCTQNQKKGTVDTNSTVKKELKDD